MKFNILLLNTSDREIARFVIENLMNVFYAEADFIGNEVIPKTFYNPVRMQYLSDYVIDWLSGFKRDGLLVAIADVDAYTRGLNFVLGMANPYNGMCVVYLPRLRYFIPEGLSKEEVFYSRLLKEVLHEVGHLFHLTHCSNSKCVMRFSNSIFDTDHKEARYCLTCSFKLMERGVRLNPKYILT